MRKLLFKTKGKGPEVFEMNLDLINQMHNRRIGYLGTSNIEYYDLPYAIKYLLMVRLRLAKAFHLVQISFVRDLRPLFVILIELKR